MLSVWVFLNLFLTSTRYYFKWAWSILDYILHNTTLMMGGHIGRSILLCIIIYYDNCFYCIWLYIFDDYMFKIKKKNFFVFLSFTHFNIVFILLCIYLWISVYVCLYMWNCRRERARMSVCCMCLFMSVSMLCLCFNIFFLLIFYISVIFCFIFILFLLVIVLFCRSFICFNF